MSNIDSFNATIRMLMQYRVFQTRHKETDRTFYPFENSLALPNCRYRALGNESISSDWKWTVLSVKQRREVAQLLYLGCIFLIHVNYV
jgi:hypothetical protein